LAKTCFLTLTKDSLLNDFYQEKKAVVAPIFVTIKHKLLYLFHQIYSFMKNQIFLSVLLSFASIFGVNAQTNQGSWMFGLHNFASFSPTSGSGIAPTNALGVGFGSYKLETDGEEAGKLNYANFGFSGNAHYFIVDNLSAGLLLNFSTQKVTEDGGSNDISASLFLAGPELRYFIDAGSKAKVWIGGSGAFGASQYDYGDSDNSVSLARFGGGAGIAIFPNEHFSIDLGLGYNGFISKDTVDDFSGNSVEEKETTSGLSLDIGFSIFLGK
jgi:hypothetical protein